ncbi:hypothetical protein BXZ70DRAFT_993337 [Cristinia sonorae]|uniref:Peptidase S59 domain-containing protein n=1 Tax=Cristinia sonorae TaxID=1940300 RepID=A0A8K0UIP9_9AGAR|nr:hypothetical protein BXZ70DRAFT_993337 [Cristinia sonorae]
MFGQNSNLTSTWGQPQQNQQQGTSAFGQPAATSTFGTAGAFGSGGAFGQQPQQQQQPQANPMFGGLGTTNTTTPTFGSTGAFGATNNASTGTSLFGAPKPATGFGAFSGGTGAFGNNTAGTSTGTGLFGGATNTNTAGTGAFGGTSLFGAPKPAVGFGATPSQTGGAFGAATTENAAPVTTGTSNPPYAVYDEKDSTNSSLTLHYQSITCMPAYRGSSFEELRFQDYSQGRKTAGAFGQTAFGGTQPQQQTTGLFGQPAANPAPAATGGLFGGGNAFGNTNTATAGTTGFGAFGQAANPTQPAGGGLFGGTAFGQPQQQTQQPATTGAFGAFGQPQQPQQNAGGGLFGGGTAFGATQNQPKPAFGGFGTNTGTTNAFGTSTTSAFGQPQQPQQTNTGGLFGQQQQPAQQQTTGFGAFGANNNAPKPSLFGNTQPTGTTGFGAFGQQQQAQPGQPQPGAQPAAGGLFGGGGGGLFGNTQQQQQQPQQTGGLFGNTQQPSQAQPGGLFGNTTGGGLFGATNNQQQQNPQQQTQGGGFGLFGQKSATTAPAGGGLFGGFGQSTTTPATNTTQTQGGGLFGGGQSTAQQPANTGFGGGSLFGKPTTGFGATQNQSQAGSTVGGGSLFGNFGASTNNAVGQPQGSLTASIAQPIGVNLPIWSMLPPGPRTVPLEQPKKKPAFFVDVPTRSPVPRLQLGYTPAPSKLRGFASTAGPAPGSSLNFSSGNPNALSLSKSSSRNLLTGPDSFLNGNSGGGLGSGSKHSVKKLTLDKKVEPTDFFKSSASQSKINFSPALGVAAREIEAHSSPQRPQPAASPVPHRGTPGRFTAQGSIDAEPQQKVSTSEPAELQEGDYYVKPDLEDLRRKSYEELCAFSGLVVGRVGYGEIHFLEPVDLTGLPKLGALLGQLIRFDDKECTVYPESDEVDKPPPGSGLNVKARIELIRCWPLDKATREPIKDEKHPSVARHLKRLKHIKDTHFESFDLEEGKWTFTVDHF